MRNSSFLTVFACSPGHLRTHQHQEQTPRQRWKHFGAKIVKTVVSFNADPRVPCVSAYPRSVVCEEDQRPMNRPPCVSAPDDTRLGPDTARPPISFGLHTETHSCRLMSPFPSHSFRLVQWDAKHQNLSRWTITNSGSLVNRGSLFKSLQTNDP